MVCQKICQNNVSGRGSLEESIFFSLGAGWFWGLGDYMDGRSCNVLDDALLSMCSEQDSLKQWSNLSKPRLFLGDFTVCPAQKSWNDMWESVSLPKTYKNTIRRIGLKRHDRAQGFEISLSYEMQFQSKRTLYYLTWYVPTLHIICV